MRFLFLFALLFFGIGLAYAEDAAPASAPSAAPAASPTPSSPPRSLRIDGVDLSAFPRVVASASVSEASQAKTGLRPEEFVLTENDVPLHSVSKIR